MGLKSFLGGLFGKSSITSNPTESMGDSASARSNLIGPYSWAGYFGWGEVRASQAWRYYKEIAPIRDAIDLGSDSFLTVPFAIQDTQDNNALITEFNSKIPATRLLEILQKPNDCVSESTFRESNYKSYHVTGETFLLSLSLDPQSEPTELYFINSKHITMTKGSDEIVKNIRINQGPFRGTYYREESDNGVYYLGKDGSAQLKQIKEFNPDNTTDDGRGLSKLSSVYYEIEELAGVHKHNNSMLKKGVRPSGALIPNTGADGMGSNLSETQIQQIKDDIREFYSGSNNAGNVMVLDGIKEFKELSVNNKDMEFMNLLEHVTNQVYRNLRIPQPLVSASAMTLNNFGEAKYMLVDLNTIPFAMKYVEEINRFLMPRYDDSGRYKLVVDIDNIPAIQLRRFQKIKDFQSDLTRNERREILGYEEHEDGNTFVDSQPSPTSTETIESAKSKEEWIDDMRYYHGDKFTEEEIQSKARDLYGCH